MQSRLQILLLIGVLAGISPAAQAGITVYEEDGTRVEFGGRLQIQYHLVNPETGETTDDFFFRRARAEFEAQINEEWLGKLQLEVGGAADGDELELASAYVSYLGWENATLTIGNQYPGFSRELLTSDKRTQLVERSFVGDHNYGALDRSLVVWLEGERAGGRIQWGLGGGQASIDPDADRLDFDTPVNADSDFNDGWVVAGNLDYFPLGEFRFAQGDFDHGPTEWGFRVSGYSWSNDGDNNTYTDPATELPLSDSKVDIDSATGVELSAALRSHGFSVDAQANQIDANTVPGAFTGGLYRDGSTTLDVLAIEGGYMFGQVFEIVAGWDRLDADDYADSWNRTSVGFNIFFEKHDVKIQTTYRIGENVNGVPGIDADEAFVQFQFVW